MALLQLSDAARIEAQSACVAWQKRESKTPLRDAAKPVADWVRKHGAGSSREDIAGALLALAVAGYVTPGEVATLQRYVAPGTTAEIADGSGYSIRASLSASGDKVGFILSGDFKGKKASDFCQRWYVAKDIVTDQKRFNAYLAAVRETAAGLAAEIG